MWGGASMPIYEFECKSCNAVSEFQMKFSDPHPKSCPRCQSDSLEKLMSATAFHLKGGGWYSEGYSNKKADKETAPTDKSGTETSGDTKEAKTTEKATEKATEKTTTKKETPTPTSKSKASESST